MQMVEWKMISRKEISSEIKETTLQIAKEHAGRIELIHEIYDLFESVFDYASRFFVDGVTALPHDYNRHSICFSSLYKSLIGINNTMDSVLQGRIGLALLSLRQIVEYLVVAKAAVLDTSNTILCDWIEQRDINLQRGIYNHIELKKEDEKGIDQLRDFFKMLGGYVHSSRESQQVSHNYENIKEQVDFVFSLVLVIFQMYRHLLFTIYMPNLSWYLEYYCPDVVNKIKSLKLLLDEDSKLQSTSARRVVNFYKRKWAFKQRPPLSELRKQKLEEYRKRSAG